MSESERRMTEEEAAAARPPEPVADRGIGRSVALVLAGIGIGAGLALLLAPKRGNEVRDAIGRGYRKTVEGLAEQAQILRERAQNLSEDLRERAPKLLRFSRRRAGERVREG